tara:strand:+ start:456 stop:851 length:396 start_codon:yes stop_codon:yes gene_type:complete
MTTRDELIAIASTYLFQGLLEHKPDEVLFADDCVRIEMGWETGGNAEELRELLAGDAYLANKAITDLVWVVEDPYVDARFCLELHGMDVVMRIATRFRIENGEIQHIEILFNGGELHAMIMQATEPLRTDL